MKPIDRRTLLISGGVGIGLVVAFAAWPRRIGSGLTAAKGDLVHITGRVRQNNYEAGGTTHYGVDLIADAVAILARKDGSPADDDKQD